MGSVQSNQRPLVHLCLFVLSRLCSSSPDRLQIPQLLPPFVFSGSSSDEAVEREREPCSVWGRHGDTNPLGQTSEVRYVNMSLYLRVACESYLSALRDKGVKLKGRRARRAKRAGRGAYAEPQHTQRKHYDTTSSSEDTGTRSPFSRQAPAALRYTPVLYCPVLKSLAFMIDSSAECTQLCRVRTIPGCFEC